jgi:hypothetical protein
MESVIRVVTRAGLGVKDSNWNWRGTRIGESYLEQELVRWHDEERKLEGNANWRETRSVGTGVPAWERNLNWESYLELELVR